MLAVAVPTCLVTGHAIRLRRRRSRRALGVVVGIITTLVFGGCVVSQPPRLRSGNNEPGSILRDNAISIDLRRRPTRADLGFIEGRNARAYQQDPGKPLIAATLVLPTGTLRVPAFIVNADGNDFTAAGMRNPRPPQRIVVERVFRTGAEAAASLHADAALLELDRGDLEATLLRVARDPRPALPQRGSLSGFVRDWLAASVDVIGHEDPSVQVNYTFTIDQYHNPAIDKVVDHGVVGIDLTRRPSRADLAFRDTYSIAEIVTPPDGRLAARLTLPGGVLQHSVTSVVSSTTADGADDPAGDGEPKQTSVSLESSGVTGAERTLRADAGLLGLDAAAVNAVFRGARGKHVKRILTGRSTPVFRVAAVVDVTLGQPGAFAANVEYRFSYR